MAIVARVDELCGDAQPVGVFADTALQHVRDAQLPRNLRHRQILALEGKRCRARGHAQVRYAHQRVENFFGQSIREVFLIAVLTQIRERQDHDGGFSDDAARIRRRLGDVTRRRATP